ncbi:hypothetical protein EVAR_21076_1 [Eumeta japonica]|uniref:VWFC domain-containing protein n=1 Tax=Eumeta variegata TaxID=151549 RepID=A0A4C1V1A4_EUMVA|nr:hypothetical protein EVAR_21076_1 [Eumeta japonica]
MMQERGDWATGNLTQRTKYNSANCYFTTVFCASVSPWGRPVGALPARSAGLQHHSSDDNTCTVGSVTYLAGATVPGDTACDNCTCSAEGRVRCARVHCEPRPGCKALHRPDHCCPTYQCECEQDGRRYGNGEKLVDPEDPCRVCYCQGGEVVCRRIACFRRDDCRPRHVPGRCCPEYDHCPLRGISTVPGSTATLNATLSETDGGAAPVPSDAVKQEITIKEITPVSEIPVITEVKIKEVLPTQSAEDAEHGASRAPLTQRGAAAPPPAPGLGTDTPPDNDSMHPLATTDMFLSKVSSSMDSSGNGGASGDATSAQPGAPAQPAPAPEDDDPSLFEHNPAFPPLPDDLSVLTEREDEIAVEHQTSDVTRGTSASPAPAPALGTVPPSERRPSIDVDESAAIDASVLSISVKDDAPGESRSAAGTETSDVLTTTPVEDSDATMRSEEVTRDLPIGRAPHRARPLPTLSSSPTTELDKPTTVSVESLVHDTTTHLVETSRDIPNSPIDAQHPPATTVESASNETPISSEANVFTDVSMITDGSAETRAPVTDAPAPSTSRLNLTPTVPLIDSTSAKLVETLPTRASVTDGTSPDVEQDVESTEVTNLDDSNGTESVTSSENTTEEGVTDAPSRATAHPPRSNKNVLADLIDLVGDVASIGERTDGPRPPAAAPSAPSAPTAIAESEEFILVNPGYKSKNSNWNSNSITEQPDKAPRRPIAVELDDDEPEGVTEAPRPGDRAEPTTRRPLIDRVTPGAQPAAAHDDIEIITQAYVPGIARRPTKVVQGEPEDELASALAAAPRPVPTPSPSPASEPTAH